MIFANYCSRVVQSLVKKFCVRNVHTSFTYDKLFYNKEKEQITVFNETAIMLK